MRRRHIYIGDYVRLTDEYLGEWSSERPERLLKLRETIFLVIESCRCYSWRYGMGGAGMIVTLKPFLGPLAGSDILLGRGDSSLEIMEPEEVDRVLSMYVEK